MTVRLLRRRTEKRTGVPYITTSVRIYGQRQIELFERLCQATGRQPHELAADAVLDELLSLTDEPGPRKLAREQRRWRASLLGCRA